MYSLAEKSLVLGSEVLDALKACKQMLCERFEKLNLQIVLFGSQARGQADAFSDVDLLIIADNDLTASEKRAIHDLLYEISLEYDVVISSIITTRRQWESPVTQLLGLYRNIAEEGIRVA